ncbi:MAG: hypothetical protein COT74_02210 [Bdellovibrionales bacterium CG10_big_fil_rev_8_21_14_0_10_45_34]|nr:MAG: hypothetical protein COT74_02210 [Bdellovibrionales bacterium CG10_big_fil_rev_8_21_14_0_10_45_34]
MKPNIINLKKIIPPGFVSILFLAALIVLFLPGCGQVNPTYSLLADQNVFKQSDADISNKLDILWVIDNSGSMGDDQQNLADNFESFISSFVQKDYDFQIAVIPTDTYRGHFLNEPERAKFRGFEGDRDPTYPIILPGLDDVIAIFQDNVIQGIFGSGDERAFQSMKYSLESNYNQGFLREKSFLAVIVVSDEDDFSHDGATVLADYDNPDLHPISHYTSFLDGVTGSTDYIKRYSVSAMAIFDEACEASNDFGYIGYRYKEMVEATDGVLGSICDDFASTLDAIQNRIAELSTQFYLTRVPDPATIIVIVDGKAVPEDKNRLNGWSYNAETNSIFFHGSYIPAQGATISVTFDPVTIKE